MCEEETASSRAFQGDGTTGVRIKEDREGRIWESPFVAFSLFLGVGGSSTPLLVFVFPASPSPPLPLSAFHHDMLSVQGTGGKRSRFMM